MDDQTIEVCTSNGRVVVTAIAGDLFSVLKIDADDALRVAGVLMECADEILEGAAR